MTARPRLSSSAFLFLAEEPDAELEEEEEELFLGPSTGFERAESINPTKETKELGGSISSPKSSSRISLRNHPAIGDPIGDPPMTMESSICSSARNIHKPLDVSHDLCKFLFINHEKTGIWP